MKNPATRVNRRLDDTTCMMVSGRGGGMKFIHVHGLLLSQHVRPEQQVLLFSGSPLC